MQLTLRQLRYFVAIAEARNMRRAAGRLNVAPTALSLQVKAMEEMFGIRLLNRHSRGVSLTAVGEDLYGRALAILSQVEETERAIRPQAPPSEQVIRVGMPPAVARTFGVQVMLGAAETFDGLILQASEGWSSDLMERLHADTLDFVVGYTLEPAEGIEVVELLEERFVLVGTPEVIGARRRVSLSEALDMELVFYGLRSVSWVALNEAIPEGGNRAAWKLDVDAVDIWRSMLCRGVAAAITPFGAVAEECQRGDLVVCEVDQPPLIRRLSLAGSAAAFAAGRRSGLVEFLTDLIVETHLELGPYYRVLTPVGSGGN